MGYKRSLSNLIILMIIGLVVADPDAIFTEECEADSNCGSGQRCGHVQVHAIQNDFDPPRRTNYPGMTCVDEDACIYDVKNEKPSFNHTDEDSKIYFEIFVYDCYKMDFIKKYWYVGLCITGLGIISIVLVFFNIKSAKEKKMASKDSEAQYNQF